MKPDEIFFVIIQENFVERFINLVELDDREVSEVKHLCVLQCRYEQAAHVREYEKHIYAVNEYLKIALHIPKSK